MVDLEILPTTTEPAPPAPRTMPDNRSSDDNHLPPRGGLPLGSILGVTISLLVALVLGVMTAVQLHREEHGERVDREELLAESLAPLAAEIEHSADLGEISQHLSSSAAAEIARGQSVFSLILRDGDGQVVASADTGVGASSPPDSLQANIPVRSELLASGHGMLTVSQDASGFAAEMANLRLTAWLDIGATVLAIIIVVQLATYLLVTRPLDHLLTAIEKVELGYPAKLRQSDIARELRWLAWRFHRMSSSLTNSARLLVAAHRRAMEVSNSRSSSDFDPRILDPFNLDRGGHSVDHDIFRRYLRSRCALLEGCRPGDHRAREVARQVWERDAVEAEKLGEMDLRDRAENAALQILDPHAFENVGHQLETLIGARAEWCAAITDKMRNALAIDGVPLVVIQHRAKHAAGAWRKMTEKGLSLEEVNDLVAFRIIVPNQDDCYLALETVHRLFEPEPFRFKDYITGPKANGYQSLHTSLRDDKGFRFEVQIRTVDMHRAAEEGFAAHWRYRVKKAIRA
jgi:ppGpp synthetase/RelA/SpoT-type nucleotidyltranferase/HAMP domain-containing protein